MASFAVVLRHKGVDLSTYTVASGGLVIGRSSECDVSLADSLVSRKHARIGVEDDGLYITDLQSRNGVFVNGSQVESCRLQENDEIAIGSHTFLVIRTGVEETLADTGSVISYEKAHSLYQEMIGDEGRGRLPILYKAAQVMGTVFDQDDLLGQILQLIFQAVPARRGFILTLSPETRQPLVRARLPVGMSVGEPPLSQTLIRHVFAQKNAILTRNALVDERFGAADSIVQHQVHAAMCAPLWGRDTLVGAIYVDSPSETALFSEEDLELLAVLGRIVGVAIENAQLHQEKLRGERMAAIGQAAAGIGHCVKNMLVGIKGGEEFIDSGLNAHDWKWIEKGWPLIRRSLDRVEQLVMNLLAFTRDVQPTLRPTQLEHLVGEVFDVVRPQADRCRVALQFDPCEVGMVYVDSREMFRVILNLVTNAVEACEAEGGMVKVAAWRDARGCYIQVADTGPGIAPEIRDRLFHAFVTTKGSRGTGLGLACCDRIVRAHLGEIRVESAPGAGAQFTVFLPHRTIVSQESDENHPEAGS